MQVTTGSNSGCENKLAQCLERVVGEVDSVHVSMDHLSKGPATVTIKARGFPVSFRMELSEIRMLMGEEFDRRVKQRS